jgi:hypothetical protein
VTLIWFVVWFIFDRVGDREPLLFDPVDWWAGSLLLVAALDLSRQHAPKHGRTRARASSRPGRPRGRA